MAEKSKGALVLSNVHNNLETLLKQKAAALPKNFNQTRFLQNTMTVLMEVKNIEKMDAKSVARTMLKGAFLGLDFFNRECYAIPYGNVLNFQTDYKGEVKLAKKYSLYPIQDIYSKLVREGDVFREKIVDGKQTIDFDPKSFNNSKIIGAFAVCFYRDGSMLYETMTVEEMEKVRKTYSKMPNGKAWSDSTGEMYRKTVLRRLTKNIQLDFENADQDLAYEEDQDAKFDAEEIDYEPIEMPKLVDDSENKSTPTPSNAQQTNEAPDDSKDVKEEEPPKNNPVAFIDLESETIIKDVAKKNHKNIDEALKAFGHDGKLETLPQSQAHDFIKFLKE